MFENRSCLRTLIRIFRELEGNSLCYCDTVGALGSADLCSHPKVHCMNVSTGRTSQAFVRLSEKVLANIENYLG